MKLQCNDCGFVGPKEVNGQCPYCHGDDWRSLMTKRKQPKKKHRKDGEGE
jgi:predicted ATP-dependent serine protease